MSEINFERLDLIISLIQISKTNMLVHFMMHHTLNHIIYYIHYTYTYIYTINIIEYTRT